jgi:hypothetical protein
MSVEYNHNTNYETAFEHLSEEYHVPISEITRLYDIELKKVGIGARITNFLSVFAFRNLKEILSLHKFEPPNSSK